MARKRRFGYTAATHRVLASEMGYRARTMAKYARQARSCREAITYLTKAARFIGSMNANRGGASGTRRGATSDRTLRGLINRTVRLCAVR